MENSLFALARPEEVFPSLSDVGVLDLPQLPDCVPNVPKKGMAKISEPLFRALAAAETAVIASNPDPKSELAPQEVLDHSGFKGRVLRLPIRSLDTQSKSRRSTHSDRALLATVIETCQTSANLSDAGRKLFTVSREKK
ncbi:MAG: hypothetical protein ACFUZC_04775 [Chthoniobacteraceae bacterium]